MTVDFQRIGRQTAGRPLAATDGYAGETLEAVLGAIRAHDFDNDGWSCPSQELIGMELGLTRFTVLRVVRILRELGLLVVAKAQRKGHWPHNRYWLPPNAVRVFRKPLVVLVDKLKTRSTKRLSQGKNGLGSNQTVRDHVVEGRQTFECSDGARAGPARRELSHEDVWALVEGNLAAEARLSARNKRDEHEASNSAYVTGT